MSNVSVFNPATLTINNLPSQICQNAAPFNFSVDASYGPAPIDYSGVQWSGSGFTALNGNVASINPASLSAGTYTVYYQINNPYGQYGISCNPLFVSKSFTIVAPSFTPLNNSINVLDYSCPNPTITVPGTQGFNQFKWFTADGTYITTTTLPSYTPANASIGTYTYHMAGVQIKNGCTFESNRMKINFSIAKENANNTLPTTKNISVYSCPTPTIVLDGLNTPLTEFNWYSQSGNLLYTSNNSPPTYNPGISAEGTYTYTVKGVERRNGCVFETNAMTVNVTIQKEIPNAPFASLEFSVFDGNQDFIKMPNSTVYKEFRWYANDNTPNLQYSSQYSSGAYNTFFFPRVPKPGDYTYSVSGVNRTSDCFFETKRFPVTIHVFARPTIRIADLACGTDQNQLSLKCFGNYPNTATFAWTGPNIQGDNNTQQIIVTPQSSAETYSLTLTVNGLTATTYYTIGQLDGGNYTRTSGPLIPVQDYDAVKTLSKTQVNVMSTYTDLLGYPVQSVEHNISPTQRDIVQPVVNDALGRQPKQYMPYSIGGIMPEGFHKNALCEQKKFYKDSLQTDFAYAKTDFENSPSSRALASYTPGESYVGNNQKQTQTLLFNTANQVRKLKPSYGYVPNTEVVVPKNLILNQYDPQKTKIQATESIELATGFEITSGELTLEIVAPTTPNYDGLVNNNGYYAAGQLVRVESKDEQGYLSRQYMNKSGQVILEEIQADVTASKFYQNYYVYDDFGNVRYVFPPKACELLQSNGWVINGEVVGLSFYYEYDEKQRPVVVKSPNMGEIHVVYDPLDNPILTQDAIQRAGNQWTFTKYDALARPVLSGIYNTSLSHDQLQANSKANFYVYETKTTNSAYKYYTNQAMPVLTASDKIETVNYYDHYNFDEQGEDDASYNRNFDKVFSNGDDAPKPFLYAKGAVTGNLTALELPNGTPTWLRSVVFYDDKGRIIQGQEDNHLGGVDINTGQYDFVGQLLKSYTLHQNPNVPEVRLQNSDLPAFRGVLVQERFTYDHAGRPLKSFQKINDQKEEKIAEYRFNELDQLAELKMGNQTLQTAKFKYNLLGALEKFNNLTTIAQPTGSDKDLFAFTLAYQKPLQAGTLPINNTPRLDGNITAVSWKTVLDSVQRAYSYQYDPLSRLESANYLSQKPTEAYSERDIQYDAGGNITSLKRDGVTNYTESNNTYTYGSIDQLSYTYKGNQLMSVSDQAAATGIAGDFQDNYTLGDDYAYDLNGNLSIDRNKNITSIQYNRLNLPTKITWGNGDYIENLYDKAGNKLRSTVYKGGFKTSQTDYVGAFVYDMNQLSFMHTSAGRYLFDLNKYEYHLKDHLGNLRVTFRAGDTTTLATGIEASENPLLFTELKALASSEQNHGGALSAKLTNTSVKVLKKPVRQKDNINIELWTLPKPGAQTSNSPLNNMSIYIQPQFNQQNAYEQPNVTNIQNVAVGVGIQPQNSAPAAAQSDIHLKVMFYGEDSTLISTQNKKIDNSNGWVKTSLLLDAPKNGYFEIHLENNGENPAYADDFKIVITQSLITQENHYYAMGMNMVGIEKQGNPNHRFQFNEMTERIKDKGLNWDFTTFRSYDPNLGRFHQVDPLGFMAPGMTPYHYSNNNFISLNDPTGLCPECPVGEQSGQTYVSQGGETYIYDGKDWVRVGSELETVEVTAEREVDYTKTQDPTITSSIYSNEDNSPKSLVSWIWPEQEKQSVNVAKAMNYYDPSNPPKLATGAIAHDYTIEGLFIGNKLFNGVFAAASTGVSRLPVLSGNFLSKLNGILKARGGFLSGGKTFAQYKRARGGTETLAKISTSTGIQRISTEFHHVFLTQRMQRTYNLPNWAVNNRLNVWKLNTVQHALIDSYRYKFLRAGFKPDVGWFGKYNWFTKF